MHTLLRVRVFLPCAFFPQNGKVYASNLLSYLLFNGNIFTCLT